MPWYRIGTVAVTLNSKAVVGTGTAWSSLSGNAVVGSGFRGPDGRMYEIGALNSDTSITLVENYLGATASGQTYAIMPTPGLAADLAKGVGDLISVTNATVGGATTVGKSLLQAADAGAARSIIGAVNKTGDTMSGVLAAPGFSAPGINSTYGLDVSSFFTEGSYRSALGVNLSGVGDTQRITAHHQPGVESFTRITSGTKFFEMLNSGVGRSPGGWTVYSDRRVKENIRLIDKPLLRIRRLSGYTFDRIDMRGMDGRAPRKAGHIAQEAMNALTETVVVPDSYDAERDEGDLLSMHHDGVAALHTECIKALEDEIEALKQRLAQPQ